MAATQEGGAGSKKISVSMTEELELLIRQYIHETTPERPGLKAISFSGAIDGLVGRGLEANRTEHGKSKELK